MVNKKQGFTLTELLVTIIIIGIVGVSVINILANRRKIKIKQQEEVAIINEVDTLLNVFTENPLLFPTIYQSFYDEKQALYVIFFNNKNHYYEVNYLNKETEITLKIIIFRNGQIYKFNNLDEIKRSIYLDISSNKEGKKNVF